MAYIPTLRTRTYECKIQTPLALHEHHHQTELMITSSVTTSAHPKLPRNRHRPERSRVTTSAPHAPAVRLVCDNGLTGRGCGAKTFKKLCLCCLPAPDFRYGWCSCAYPEQVDHIDPQVGSNQTSERSIIVRVVDKIVWHGSDYITRAYLWPACWSLACPV